MEQGKRYLFAQESRRAIDVFHDAMEDCPEQRTVEMSEILFFMGAAYRNLGQNEYAYRCWENAAMLRDKEEHEYDLDWRAFYRIQLVKYLSGKQVQQFGSLAESDMIHGLIKMTWSEVRHQNHLMNHDFHERCGIYRSVRIIFPRIETEQSGQKKKMGQIVTFSRNRGNGGKK